MMKGTNIGTSTSKGSTGASNLVHSDNPLKCNSASDGSELKGKMRLQSVTTSIIQEGASKANAWKPGGFNGLAGGSVSHQMNCKGPNNPGEIYSVSEEAGESESEEQDDSEQGGNLNCNAAKNQNKETERDGVNKTEEEDDEMSYMRKMCDEEMNETNRYEGSRL